MSDQHQKHNLLSVPRLLLALTTMATLTFGMFIFEAERALYKLDNIETQNALQNTIMTVNQENILRLQRVQDGITVVIGAHENRLTTLEVRDHTHQ